MKVKICGITSLEDARMAIEAGADALGFNFYAQSPRCISLPEAQTIVRQLPADVWTVGVFVNHDAAEVEWVASTVGLNTLQFHGDEDEDMLGRWKSWRVIKAVRIHAHYKIDEVQRLLQVADYLLIDKYCPDVFGGSGKLVEDNVMEGLAGSAVWERSLLAGGLTPDNVKERIEKVCPFGVDVASGVESSPGVKDRKKVTDFTFAVRSLKLR